MAQKDGGGCANGRLEQADLLRVLRHYPRLVGWSLILPCRAFWSFQDGGHGAVRTLLHPMSVPQASLVCAFVSHAVQEGNGRYKEFTGGKTQLLRNGSHRLHLQPGGEEHAQIAERGKLHEHPNGEERCIRDVLFMDVVVCRHAAACPVCGIDFLHQLDEVGAVNAPALPLLCNLEALAVQMKVVLGVRALRRQGREVCNHLFPQCHLDSGYGLEQQKAQAAVELVICPYPFPARAGAECFRALCRLESKRASELIPVCGQAVVVDSGKTLADGLAKLVVAQSACATHAAGNKQVRQFSMGL